MSDLKRYKNSALVIAGHGSTVNADSSAPTFVHADEIRRRGIFSEVHVCFWKEEPNFRQVFNQVEASEIYVVPNFISSGYFTEQVIPRELGLDGALTKKNGKVIKYCEPVGLHPQMTEALLQRAEQVVEQSNEKNPGPLSEVALLICGHGTSLNDNSTKIVYEQAGRIAAKKIYSSAQACFMEQEPFVKEWRTLVSQRNVIVVPFFISDGLHSYEDIPFLLGITQEAKPQAFQNPFRDGDRRLWYASAIGTEPYMAEVILAQVQKFDELNNAV